MKLRWISVSQVARTLQAYYGTLDCVLSSRSHGDALVLAGTIDEAAGMVALVLHAKNGRLVLDLRDVAFINSIGVREWIRMQQAAQAAGVRIELRRVTEPIVHQLNIVVATRGV